ncbi:hypothetical protein EDD21DRAFT_35630 [Dissophora ornata]|nr:hypothetical protein EDD21DRAFT_35630 [Dissophora ornata]
MFSQRHRSHVESIEDGKKQASIHQRLSMPKSNAEPSLVNHSSSPTSVTQLQQQQQQQQLASSPSRSSSDTSMPPHTHVATMTTSLPTQSPEPVSNNRQQVLLQPQRGQASGSTTLEHGAPGAVLENGIQHRSMPAGKVDGSQLNDQMQPSTARTIPSTFITLVDTQDIDSDDDDDGPKDAQDSGPGRKRTLTTGTVPTAGPYLSIGAAGQRSLSTPNLHGDNSLIISPANSPPGSPGLPPIASVTGAADASLPPPLSLDGDGPSPSESPVLTPSPMTSPESSPRLAPRASIASVSGMTPAGARIVNGDRPGSRAVPSAKTKAPPAPDSSKTLKSAKNKAVNRNSVMSLFDTAGTSMTLPTNFARKGSLPRDTVNAGNHPGLAGLFDTQPQDLTSTPFSLTLAEFRLNDLYPKRQRRLLTLLHRMDHRLRKEGVVKKLTKEQLKGKPGAAKARSQVSEQRLCKEEWPGRFHGTKDPCFPPIQKAQEKDTASHPS